MTFVKMYIIDNKTSWATHSHWSDASPLNMPAGNVVSWLPPRFLHVGHRQGEWRMHVHVSMQSEYYWLSGGSENPDNCIQTLCRLKLCASVIELWLRNKRACPRRRHVHTSVRWLHKCEWMNVFIPDTRPAHYYDAEHIIYTRQSSHVHEWVHKNTRTWNETPIHSLWLQSTHRDVRAVKLLPVKRSGDRVVMPRLVMGLRNSKTWGQTGVLAASRAPQHRCTANLSSQHWAGWNSYQTALTHHPQRYPHATGTPHGHYMASAKSYMEWPNETAWGDSHACARGGAISSRMCEHAIINGEDTSPRSTRYFNRLQPVILASAIRKCCTHTHRHNCAWTGVCM